MIKPNLMPGHAGYGLTAIRRHRAGGYDDEGQAATTTMGQRLLRRTTNEITPAE